MRKLSVVFALSAFVISAAVPANARKGAYVHPYTKKDGTQVSGHYRKGDSYGSDGGSYTPPSPVYSTPVPADEGRPSPQLQSDMGDAPAFPYQPAAAAAAGTKADRWDALAALRATREKLLKANADDPERQDQTWIFYHDRVDDMATGQSETIIELLQKIVKQNDEMIGILKSSAAKPAPTSK